MDPDPVGSASFCRFGVRTLPNGKLKTKLISRKCHYTVQNIENYDTFDAEEKDETMKTGTAANKNHKISNLNKTWGRIRLGIKLCRSTTLAVVIVNYIMRSLDIFCQVQLANFSQMNYAQKCPDLYGSLSKSTSRIVFLLTPSEFCPPP